MSCVTLDSPFFSHILVLSKLMHPHKNAEYLSNYSTSAGDGDEWPGGLMPRRLGVTCFGLVRILASPLTATWLVLSCIAHMTSAFPICSAEVTIFHSWISLTAVWDWERSSQSKRNLASSALKLSREGRKQVVTVTLLIRSQWFWSSYILTDSWTIYS